MLSVQLSINSMECLLRLQSLGMNPFQKNPKHASVLAESGIGYDKPLPPIQVASQRAERIAKEKKVCTVYCIFSLDFD